MHNNPNTVVFVLPITVYSLTISYLPNVSAKNPIYCADKAWFAANANRSWVIRKVGENEFPGELESCFMYDGHIVAPPQLWCLVIRHPRLGHRVEPVWRGSLPLNCDASGYLTADSDDLTGHYLDEMAKTSGLNQLEWLDWSAKWNASTAISSAPHSRKVN